jgi:hypothetical protein
MIAYLGAPPADEPIGLNDPMFVRTPSPPPTREEIEAAIEDTAKPGIKHPPTL